MPKKTAPTKAPGRSLTSEERADLGQTKLQVWLDSKLVARLDAEAKRAGSTRTALVSEALERLLKR